MKRIKISNPVITAEMFCQMKRVIDEEQMLVNGEEVRKLEKEFANYIGTKYAVATSCGTMALTIACRCLDINGDVLMPATSFIATPDSVVTAGGKPVYIDINKYNWNIDIDKLKMSVDNTTQAIMPVHLYGLPCDMKRIKEIATEHAVPIIEDSCQAHGAMYKGKKCGSIGEIGCWSFYPTKNMQCGGNGGMITTDNLDIAETARLLISHGGKEKSKMFGYNARMNTLNAAIARVSLKNLDKENTARLNIATKYNTILSEIDNTLLKLPVYNHGRIYHQYVIRTKIRDDLKRRFDSLGIETLIHYPYSLQHLHRHTDVDNLNWRNSYTHSLECLSLPMHSGLNDADINQVCVVVLSLIMR